MKINSAEFETSAPNVDGAPAADRPEFAFIGRSNVGKSSLINLLAQQKALARVSDLPGKTRLINFFMMNRKWRLVDLPGYGYAHVARAERFEFNLAVADYLEHRQTLLQTYLLIDSRIEPQKIDIDFIGWLVGAKVPFSLVFTKTDKQSANQTNNSIDRFKRTALAGLGVTPKCFLSSSKTKAGRNDILADITARMTTG